MSTNIPKVTTRRFLQITLLVLVLAVPVAGALISFFGLVQDGVSGVDGIQGVVDLSLSPDGAYLFAVGHDDNALVAFAANDATADGLVYLDQYEDDVDGVFGLLGASGVATSPDGRHVYATAETDDTLVVFGRDASSDDLAFIASAVQENGVGRVFGLDGASAVAVSPDDDLVFVTANVDDALTVFSRDATTDDLTFTDVEFEGLAPLRGASDVAISPDSRHVYATAAVDDALIFFEREPAGSDQVNYVSHFQDGENAVDGLDGASAVAVSPDGQHVYVAGKIDNALSLYDRDPSTGALTFNTMYEEGVAGIEGLNGPSAIAIHHSGYWVFVAGRYGNTVALFERDLDTGELTLNMVLTDGIDGVDGLAGAIALASGDDRAYVAGHDDDAIATIDLDISQLLIFGDGFESGDTSAWSSVTP